MKRQIKCNRFLTMLLTIALVFSNVEIVAATERTDVTCVDATNTANVASGSALGVSDTGANEDEKLTISPGVWSDSEPYFTDDVPAENEETKIPAGVWSDKDPYFTNEVPPETARKSLRMKKASVVTIPTYQEAYELMISLKETYPEGMIWTNFEPYGSKGDLGESYRFKGGAIKGAAYGVGCAAYVFILSDKAFGSLPARTIDAGNFSYEDLKVGDILRMNSSHFVIILQISAGGIIVAEANYNKSVHWGRAISKETVMRDTNFVVTRYPEEYSEAEDNDEVAETGIEGSLNWTLTKGGTLTISGEGQMSDYDISESRPSWDAHKDKINTVIIENGITSIGNYAFYESKVLTVHIPDGVTSIGNGAFQASNLVSVTIPSTTANVGDSAFRSCENLTSASIPEGVKTIGDNAFRACTSITYLDFPSTITSIGAGAFTSCNSVVQIRFAPGTGDVTIGNGAFAQCQYLMAVTLPQGLTKISDQMFQSCTSLYGVYIPDSVNDIGENPFVSTGIQRGGTIYFGGSQTTWRNIGGQFILNAMPNANIEYDVEFEDPFAVDPNDPGDLIPDETDTPTSTPTDSPTDTPTITPTETEKPVNPVETQAPVETVTPDETDAPTPTPTDSPTQTPTNSPTVAPSTTKPIVIPSNPGGSSGNSTPIPTTKPTAIPTTVPTVAPTVTPMVTPSGMPTVAPTETPTVVPSDMPTVMPIVRPTLTPSSAPTVKPTAKPTVSILQEYKYANKVKGKSLYDSKNKRVSRYELKKGKLTYYYNGKKNNKKDKNVVQAFYHASGNLVYLKKNGTVKEIDHVTGKTKTLYKKSIKKLIPNKKKFVTKVKTKSNKIKKIKK